MKKYLIRILGSLCILGSVALMFMGGWLEFRDVSSRDMRKMRNDMDGVFESAEETFLEGISYNDDFQEELEDYDLPSTRSKIKSQTKKMTEVSKILFDGDLSLKELFDLSIKAPDLIEYFTNILDSDYVSHVFFTAAADYQLNYGSNAGEYWEQAGGEPDREHFARQLQSIAEDTVDGISGLDMVFTVLAGLLILIAVYAVICAITHVCNKGRWMKYLYLIVLLALVVGTCVALPMVADVLSDALGATAAFEDASLGITAMPFLAVALAIAPVVLDIVFERKQKNLAEG